MANKKAAAISKESKSMQTDEFLSSRDVQEMVSETALETIKSLDRDIAQPTDGKNKLRNAISKAVKRDAEDITFTSVKETKQRRRNIIVDTIMKHGRNLDS